MSAVLKYITDRPLIAHGLLGLLYTALLLLVVHPLAAFALVSVFFYGREVGQLGHDLEAKGASGFTSWWKSLLLNFDLWIIAQVVAPVVSAAGLSAGLYTLKGMALPAHFV